MRGGRASMLAASSAVALLAVLVQSVAPALVWLRVPLGLALVLLLPGYGLVTALFPGERPDRLERAVLAGGASIALAVLVGLLLATMPRGLDGGTWVFALGGLTIAGNALAARALSHAPDPGPGRMLLPRPGMIVLASAAACFLVLLVAVSARDTLRPSSGEIVQLWALPAGKGGGKVQVGVANLLSPSTLFRLRVFQGDTVLLEQPLDLPVGTSTTLIVPPSPSASRLAPMTAVLTPVGREASERFVTMWPPKSALEATSGR